MISSSNNNCDTNGSRLPVRSQNGSTGSTKRGTPSREVETLASCEDSPSQLKLARLNVSSPLARPPAFGPRRSNNSGATGGAMAAAYGLQCYGEMYGVSRPSSSGRRSSSFANRLKKRVTVCVRKRPLRNEGSNRTAAAIANANGKSKQTAVPSDIVEVDMADSSICIAAPKVRLDGFTKYVEEHRFKYDRVFDHTCSNTLVYERMIRPLVQAVLTGEAPNATCFAYGQTGSGKSHTMFNANDGVCFLAAEELISEARESDSGLRVYVSFFEIYQSHLYDLLQEKKKLMALEKQDGTVQINGLLEMPVDSCDTAFDIIKTGLQTRATGKTGANAQSSRSHALLRFTLKGRRQDDNDSLADFGSVSFIDLAGSERGNERSDVDSKTKAEGAEINKSLLALKECIRAMDCDSSHLPFRQSKLTMVLRDCLGSNGRIAMIATVSPTPNSAEHTLNTLRYAERFLDLSQDKRQDSQPNPAAGMVQGPVLDREADEIIGSAKSSPVLNELKKNGSPRVEESSSANNSPWTVTINDRIQQKQKQVGLVLHKLEEQVAVCQDEEIIDLLKEELITLSHAFSSLI